MKAQVFDLKHNAVGDIELAESVFGAEVREHLFWEVIRWQRAKRRAGTASTKGRSEVRGGGKKPWRQKGTGRARQGSIRAPHWVGGGVVFGPQPRDYGYRMPKKKRRAALISALSMRAAEGKLFVVDAFSLDAPRTKDAVAITQAFEAKKTLFVDITLQLQEGSPEHNENLRKSVRNLNGAKYLASEGLNVEDILAHDTLILSRSAVERVQEVLA